MIFRKGVFLLFSCFPLVSFCFHFVFMSLYCLGGRSVPGHPRFPGQPRFPRKYERFLFFVLFPIDRVYSYFFFFVSDFPHPFGMYGCSCFLGRGVPRGPLFSRKYECFH